MEINADYLKEMKEKEEREAKLKEEQKDKPEKKVIVQQNMKKRKLAAHYIIAVTSVIFGPAFSFSVNIWL